ncbi:hypothetical protein [Spirosoma rigui]|uniref:hypothetical protein n=1 Tax=Spirosoma rigui TaxID=564064 RepID=UPI0009B1196A|nr:hypothetical protein [Spirosoma rigui]
MTDLDKIVAIDVHTHAEVPCRQPHDGYRPLNMAFVMFTVGSPVHVSPQLKQRILFSTDVPLIIPERWRKDFHKAGFKEEIKPLILPENALNMLGLRA